MMSESGLGLRGYHLDITRSPGGTRRTFCRHGLDVERRGTGLCYCGLRASLGSQSQGELSCSLRRPRLSVSGDNYYVIVMFRRVLILGAKDNSGILIQIDNWLHFLLRISNND